MKIDGNSPNQPMFGNEPTGSDPTQSGRLGRWNGNPGTPGPSRIGSEIENSSGTDSLAKLGQRQPLWGENSLDEAVLADAESLQIWLSSSPDNILRYAEDHIMDALLSDFFRNPRSTA